MSYVVWKLSFLILNFLSPLHEPDNKPYFWFSLLPIKKNVRDDIERKENGKIH